MGASTSIGAEEKGEAATDVVAVEKQEAPNKQDIDFRATAAVVFEAVKRARFVEPPDNLSKRNT